MYRQQDDIRRHMYDIPGSSFRGAFMDDVRGAAYTPSLRVKKTAPELEDAGM